MRNWINSLLLVVTAALMVSCGGGGGGGTCLADSCVTQTPVTPLPTYNITLIFDTDQINPGTGKINLTAFVTTGTMNAAADDVPVVFSADSGTITGSGVTDSAGQASAVFTSASNKSKRDVTITATVGGSSKSVVVSVLGPQIGFGGTLSTVIGQSVQVTVDLRDSEGNAINGQAVVMSSASGSFNPSNPVTGTTGTATTMFTPGVAGEIPITATALGESANATISVSGVNFSFTEPVGSPKIDVNTCSTYEGVAVPVKVLLVGGAGQQITIATTQGELYSSSLCGAGTLIGPLTPITLDGSGSTTVYIKSLLTGTATLTATTVGVTPNASTSMQLPFVSRFPAQIALTSSPSVISAAGESTITAFVKDATNNPVSGAQVIFNGSGNGVLSPGVATTNSNGQATSKFTANGSLTGLDDLTISASVQGAAAPATTTLTVAGQAINVTIGYDNQLEKLSDEAIYRRVLNVTVSDSAQGPVEGSVVSIASIAKRYRKGTMVVGVNKWTPNVTATCFAEDLNGNGILDPDTETDENNNGNLDPQTGAVVRKPDNVTGNLVTNSGGRVTVWLEYPQNEALWVELEIQATASVSGVNSTGVAKMWIPMLAGDANNVNTSPPNQESPYGTSATCTDAL